MYMLHGRRSANEHTVRQQPPGSIIVQPADPGTGSSPNEPPSAEMEENLLVKEAAFLLANQ